MSATLTVQGYSGHLAALNGLYKQEGDNHGRPTYMKYGEVDGTTQCCVYFWDERDGDALSGWWFAPEVGGEQVWAHVASKSQTPPTRGWKVPWTASAPDNRVMVTLRAGGAAPPSSGFAAAAQAQAAKRGIDQTQQGANKFARTGYGQQAGQVQAAPIGQIPHQNAGINGMKKFPVQTPQQNPAQEARLRAQREKNLAQVTASMTSSETAVKKLSGPESKEANFNKQQHIAQAKNVLGNTTRMIDQFVKSKGLEDSVVAAQKAKLATLQRDITAAEESHKLEQKKKLDSLKTTYVAELSKLVSDAEKLIEKTKDAAVLFTCEMAEHIKPDEAMEAKAKTDAESIPATEALKKAKDLIMAKDKELRLFLPADANPIREAVKPISAKIVTAEKELNALKAQATAASRKAEVALQKLKREQEQEKARVERERVAKWNKELAGFSYQIWLVAQDVAKNCETEGIATDDLQSAESKLLGLQKELQNRHDNKDTQGPSKQPLKQYMKKIDTFLASVKRILKEQKNKGQDKDRRDAVAIAAAIRIQKGEKSDDDYFSEITGKSNKMDQFKFEKFIKTLDVEVAHPSIVFKEACKFVGTDCTVLDKSSFILFVANTYHSVIPNKSCALTKEIGLNSEKVGELEQNAVVQVLEGPTEVDGVARVKVERTKKDGTVEEGFTTLRAGGVDNLVRYSPHYTVLAETVLTDTFDLKGFKVVRRIKANEKFRAVGIPKYNKDADMWRINGVTDEKQNVWVTIQGNRGTSLLRNEPMTEIAAAARKEAEVEEFTDEKLNAMLVTMAESSRKNLQMHEDEAAKALEVVVEKLALLEAADEEGKEPSKEEIDEIVKNLDAAFAEHKLQNEKTKKLINRLAQDLRTVESGPYSELKESFPKVAESLSEQNTKVNEFQMKRRAVQKTVFQKENERRMAREKAEQEALSAELLKEVKPKVETATALVTRIDELDAKRLPEMTDSLAVFQRNIKVLTTEVNTIKEAADVAKKWIEEKVPVNPKGALVLAANELKSVRSGLTHLLNRCVAWSKKLLLLVNQFKEKFRVDFAVLLKAHLTSNAIDEEALFKSLAQGKETLSLEEFSKFARTIVPDLEQFDELLYESLGSVKELTKEHLSQLSKVSYRCLKRALVTDIVDIKSCKKLKAIEPEEIVQVMEKHTVCEKTGLVRFKGRTDDGTEGYLTIKGNKNTLYLKLQQNWYRVVKETVLTGAFEMSGVKVIRRLREGDFLRELSHPQLEEKSGLYRMKAQSVLDNEIGWVTLKNATTRFLVNCELPAPKEETPAGGEAPQEAAA